jgi:hypothetical protein
MEIPIGPRHYFGPQRDGLRAVLIYFIMGRSVNSRNRVFVETEDGIRTEAFDPAKLTDPSLVIYHPVRFYDGISSSLTATRQIPSGTICWLKTAFTRRF